AFAATAAAVILIESHPVSRHTGRIAMCRGIDAGSTVFPFFGCIPPESVWWHVPTHLRQKGPEARTGEWWGPLARTMPGEGHCGTGWPIQLTRRDAARARARGGQSLAAFCVP